MVHGLTFVLNPSDLFISVELTLWDEDYDADDQIGEAVCLPLRNIRLGIPESKTLKFGEVSFYHLPLQLINLELQC